MSRWLVLKALDSLSPRLNGPSGFNRASRDAEEFLDRINLPEAGKPATGLPARLMAGLPAYGRDGGQADQGNYQTAY